MEILKEAAERWIGKEEYIPCGSDAIPHVVSTRALDAGYGVCGNCMDFVWTKDPYSPEMEHLWK